MAQRPDDRDAKMDGAALYKEEIVTDRKVGTIRMLTPIKKDGTADSSRRVVGPHEGFAHGVGAPGVPPGGKIQIP